MPDYVFDASAVLAIAFNEPGADVALAYMARSCVSAVNYSEACAKLVDRGLTVTEAFERLEELRLDVVFFDRIQARDAASLREVTKLKRISFADRACLSLAVREDAVAVTTDRAWAELDLPCRVELIR